MRSALFLPPFLLFCASPAAAWAETYLVSIVDVPLAYGESIEAFSFSTWGVTFNAVCHIPGGWRIKAGSSATPDGVLEGEGSHGATWFVRSSPDELRDLVLVTLYGPVQPDDILSSTGEGETLIPATFAGYASISAEQEGKRVVLTTANIRLAAAKGCPAAN